MVVSLITKRNILHRNSLYQITESTKKFVITILWQKNCRSFDVKLVINKLASNIDAAADIAGGLKALPQGLKKVMDNFSPSTESAMQKEIVNAIADTAGATVDADNAIEDLKEQ